MSRGLSNFIDACNYRMQTTGLYEVWLLLVLKNADVSAQSIDCLGIFNRVTSLWVCECDRRMESGGFEVAVDGIKVCADQPPKSCAIRFGRSVAKEKLALTYFVIRVRDGAEIKAFKNFVLREA